MNVGVAAEIRIGNLTNTTLKIFVAFINLLFPNHSLFISYYLTTNATAVFQQSRCQKWTNYDIALAEDRSIRRKICPSDESFRTDPTWNGLGSKPGHGNKRLVNICLSPGTTLAVVIELYTKTEIQKQKGALHIDKSVYIQGHQALFLCPEMYSVWDERFFKGSRFPYPGLWSLM